VALIHGTRKLGLGAVANNGSALNRATADIEHLGGLSLGGCFN
jgi:hypothetical protein